MDMVWAELGIKKEWKHTEIVEIAERLFVFGAQSSSPFDCAAKRASLWRPHLSLAYDNVKDPCLNLGRVLEAVGEVGKTLVEGERKVKGMSLWNMNGRMEEWKCIDRFKI